MQNHQMESYNVITDEYVLTSGLWKNCKKKQNEVENIQNRHNKISNHKTIKVNSRELFSMTHLCSF